jgi:hypothetical protein
MNIFILDENPRQCAIYHNDRHVVKMILESTQMLHHSYYDTAHSFDGFPRDSPYRVTHKNHPCSRWSVESLDNWSWLLSLALNLCDEFKFRFHKEHACEIILSWMARNPPDIPARGITPFALAIPEHLKSNNAVISYRRYYQEEKKHLAKWTGRDTPSWFSF